MIAQTLGETRTKRKENLFLEAIRACAHANATGNFPVQFLPTHDWTREAQALMKELERYKNPPAR